MAMESSRLQAAVAGLRLAAEAVKELPGLDSLFDEYRNRADRLEQSRFTVALFGAFSAGKSSLANALLGGAVLPVSPNPTTAAINRIIPSSDEQQNQTALVIWKSADDLFDDVSRSLAVFERHIDALAHAPKIIGDIDGSQVSRSAKPHFAFLQAVASGYDRHVSQLGTESLVPMNEFRALVSHEEEACFVDRADLAYDCDVTRQGIVLVDTPCADSLNARHTDVAFEYVKNADAVLFVTYYNHAFSRSDQLFLTQLGGVKDTFALDKMFFLVNAKDLAASEEELGQVVQHVRTQLTAHGIRSPRMYAVSSQTALLARMQQQGQLSAAAEKAYRTRLRVAADVSLPDPSDALEWAGTASFERDFKEFIQTGLAEIAVRGARNELERAVSIVDDYILLAQSDASIRENKLKQLSEVQVQAIHLIGDRSADTEWLQMEQEVDELLYHVVQRCSFEFGKTFNEAFNPGSLRDDVTDVKAALRRSLDELLRDTAAALTASLRATSVIVERAMEKNIREWRNRLEADVAKLIVQFRLPKLDWFEGITPHFADRFGDEAMADLKRVLSLFRSGKQFFESGGKAAMRQEVEERLQPHLKNYMDDARTKLLQAYGERFIQCVQGVQDDLSELAEDVCVGLRAALAQTVDLPLLEERRSILLQAIAYMDERTAVSL